MTNEAVAARGAVSHARRIWAERRRALKPYADSTVMFRHRRCPFQAPCDPLEEVLGDFALWSALRNLAGVCRRGQAAVVCTPRATTSPL